MIVDRIDEAEAYTGVSQTSVEYAEAHAAGESGRCS